ncbi:MAG: WcaI family glycosyltransferase [Candidatus Omnitrophica bacterium]|nr:WcaI family glycosyltransferase [Candidatus Omnitrophota bacterium]
MRILVIGINYSPEKIGIGENTTRICEYLASTGHKVSMVTSFPHYPEWKIWDSYRGRIFMRESINGVSVYRGYMVLPRFPLNTFQRIIYDISFTISAFIIGLTIGRADVVLAVSPPLEGALSAYLLAKVKRAKFVIQLQDLVPDLAISLGILKNPFVIKLGKLLEKFIYGKARNILVICKGFMENLKTKGVPESKIEIIPNCVDINRIRPFMDNNSFKDDNGLNGKFMVLHSGNMGAKQELENVIEAARYLLDLKDIIFILAGDGPRRKSLEQKAAGSPNVRFVPLQPKDVFPNMLSSADVLVVNQNARVLDMVFPYKLLNYMSAGRSIVASVNTESETAKYVRLADCGLVVAPKQPQALAEAVRKIYVDRELGSRYGKNGRVFAQENFSQQKVLERYTQFFKNLEKNKDQA